MEKKVKKKWRLMTTDKIIQIVRAEASGIIYGLSESGRLYVFTPQAKWGFLATSPYGVDFEQE